MNFYSIIYKLFNFKSFNFIVATILYYFFLNKNLKQKSKKIQNELEKINLINKNIKDKKKVCLMNIMFHYSSIETAAFYFTILKIFNYLGFKPAVFSGFKFFKLLNKIDFKVMPPLMSYNNNISNLKLKKFNNISEIKNYKWKSISCGTFALSSTLRHLKYEDLNLKNKSHVKIFNNYLKKSILSASSFFHFIEKNKRSVGCAIFSDPGYVGQGEMFQILIKNNIPCYQFHTWFSNSEIVFKKYDKTNEREHFDSISTNIFKKICKEKSKLTYKKKCIKKKLEHLYKHKEWFPSVGTALDQNKFKYREFIKKYKIDSSKPIVVIFSHIFWDGTSFYGKDLFDTYREWFVNTIRAASKNTNVNWIVKPHPANKIQLLRHGSNKKFLKKTEEEELTMSTLGKIPDHIKFLQESTISALELYKFIDYCLTIRGTPGIESSFYGVNVVTAGTGRFEKKGFTYDPKNIRDYLQYLEKIKSKKNLKKNNKAITNSTHYIYSLLFDRTIKLQAFEMSFKKDKLASIIFRVKKTKERFYNSNDIQQLLKWIKSKEKEFSKLQFK